MMVDLKFYALYSDVFIESLQKSGYRKVIRKFVLVELGVQSLHTKCYHTLLKFPYVHAIHLVSG